MMIDRKKWTIIWTIAFAFFLIAWWDLYQGLILIGNQPSFESKRFDVFLVFQVVPLAIWGYSLWVVRTGRLPVRQINSVANFIERIPLAIKSVIVVGLLLISPYLYLRSSFGDYEIGYWFRLATLVFCALLATIILFPRDFNQTWKLRFSGIFLLTAAVFITCDWLSEVIDYPFSMAWSEGNRMWDYSMMFGSARYINLDNKPIFTFIETGRQVLWAIPFLLPNLDIAGYRLWNVLVWIIPPLLLGAALVFSRSWSPQKILGAVGFIIWCYVFLSQGPIYSPLLLAAVLVVIGVRQRSLLVGIIAVAIAAYYCQISRWTWMYAPGLWAGMLALMDLHLPDLSRSNWKKFFRPVALGLSGYFGGEFLPNIIDAIQNGFSASSVIMPIRLPGTFVQPMLWDRLFPNVTYPPGILLGMIWVGLPIILFIFWTWKARIWRPHWIQALPIVGMSAIFMVLGVVVSVKAGGGSNLHNLDMLWVTLIIVTGWIWKQWMDTDFFGIWEKKSLLVVLCLAIVMPFTTMADSGHPLRLPADDLVQGSLATIQHEVAHAQKKGEVLFLDQRQLLTFGYVKNVPLVADYEKKYLMNQALNQNAEYFAEFHKDLENHRFSLIISEPMRKALALEGDRNFAEENNVWVYWVSRPMLKYYKPLVTLDEVGVQLLVPR